MFRCTNHFLAEISVLCLKPKTEFKTNSNLVCIKYDEYD